MEIDRIGGTPLFDNGDVVSILPLRARSCTRIFLTNSFYMIVIMGAKFLYFFTKEVNLSFDFQLCSWSLDDHGNPGL